MTDDEAANRVDEGNSYIDDIDPEAPISDDRPQPTPEQHERLKNGLHGDRFTDIKRSERGIWSLDAVVWGSGTAATARLRASR